MGRKRKRNRVDTSLFNPQELAAHRKRLARVNEYVTARRIWEKKVKAGEIDPEVITLSVFRKGGIPSVTDPLYHLNATAIERVEILYRELKETRIKESRLVQEIRDLTDKTQRPLGTPNLKISG